jgi:predicted nucleic acid-binding protein
MHDVVTNTSPLLYLHQLGLLELLPRLYERVVVPSPVVAELSDGASLGYDVPSPSTLPWALIEAPPGAAILPIVTALGDGERAAIALAATRKSNLLLLDDSLARRHARLLGLTVTGTLGVVLRAKRESHLPAVAPVVDKLEHLGFRLARDTRAAVLRLAGE